MPTPLETRATAVKEIYVPNPQDYGEGCNNMSDVVGYKEFLVRDPGEYIKRHFEGEGAVFSGQTCFQFASSDAGYGGWHFVAEDPSTKAQIEVWQRYMRNRDLPSGKEVINLKVELRYHPKTPKAKVNAVKRLIVSTGLERLKI